MSKVVYVCIIVFNFKKKLGWCAMEAQRLGKFSPAVSWFLMLLPFSYVKIFAME